jgi:hypothetical protein
VDVEKTFYTYLYLRYDGTPYYVGKGSGKRAYRQSNRRIKPPKDQRNIITQDYQSEADAFAAEMFLIGFYGRIDLRTGCLRNLTDGGDGASGAIRNEETRRKMSAASSRRVFTEEHRNRIRVALIGKKRSEAVRQAMRQYRLGKKRKPFSEEHCRKLAIASKRREARKTKRIPICHPERIHKAYGLCHLCYQNVRRARHKVAETIC